MLNFRTPSFQPLSRATPISGRGAALAQSSEADEAARTKIRAAVTELAAHALEQARVLLNRADRTAAEARDMQFLPGDDLPDPVLRGQIVDAASKLIGLVDEAVLPPIAPYLTQESETTFSEAIVGAIAAAQRAEELGTDSLPDAMAPAANDFAVSILGELKEERDAAHRLIVAFEGIEGPQEPSEKIQAGGVLVAIAVVAMIGFGLWASSGKA